MAVATHLADKSALARFHHVAVARRLGPMIEAGLVGTCGIIELEVRYSARSHAEYEAVARDRALGYEWFPMTDEIWDRALDVQSELSARGELRAVKFPDLLIAATAERHGLAVIHYDADYDRIAAITGQRLFQQVVGLRRVDPATRDDLRPGDDVAPSSGSSRPARSRSAGDAVR